MAKRAVRKSVDEQVAELQRKVYGSVAKHDPAMVAYTITADAKGEVVAALDVLSATIEHAGRSYRAAGLSWVLTDPERRHEGHGSRLVAAALMHLRRQPIDLVIFTCDRPLEGFYRKAGFETLPGTVLVGGTREEPFASDQEGFDKVTVAAFVSAEARQHAADFTGARVGLYSGAVDKLW